MRKAILEFDINDRSDKQDLLQALKASDLAYVVRGFGEFLSRYDKHKDLSDLEQKLLDEIRESWHEYTADIDYSLLEG